jgi:hypothetical protein
MPCNLFLLPSSPPSAHIEAHDEKKISVNFLKLLSTYIDFTFALTLMDRLGSFSYSEDGRQWRLKMQEKLSKKGNWMAFVKESQIVCGGYWV